MPKDLPCADCAQLMWRGPNSLPEGVATCQPCRRARPTYKAKAQRWTVRANLPKKDCLGCGVTFAPLNGRQRYCNQACGWKHKPRAADDQRACEVCGVTYKPTYAKQRTCGRACGVAINAACTAARARPKLSRVNWKQCAYCAKPYTTRGLRRCGCGQVFPSRSADWRHEQPCAGCGAVMSLHRHNLRRLRCDDCLLGEKRRYKDKRRALQKLAYREDVRRADIYQRDGYRCKLCGKKLNMDAVVPHPKAPTIDHIVPLAQGGTHEPANVQAAHFICNSIKGDRGGNEQLLLIG